MYLEIDDSVAKGWIAQSAREDRIVWAEWNHDEAENLASLCTDSAVNGRAYEFWGANWRVHMHRPRGAR